jgi:CO/xanthine dehydrogenase Mo-binding subunit/aerobic-type carbon monoxide dehydrogenase small subunit (CoxS/CutS family)
MRSPAQQIRFRLNGTEASVHADPARRLTDVLRDDLGLTGTKVGCNAGDCGACTVLIDGKQLCACLVPIARVQSCEVTTVEGLSRDAGFAPLQAAFLKHGAAQCGICTPGMLMAATALLMRSPAPSEVQIRDTLAGVLCRCTGYRKIIDAVLDAARQCIDLPASPPNGAAVGARVTKVDGAGKVTGADRFGADALPEEAFLTLRIMRSPHAHARFSLADFGPLRALHPGIVAVLTASDIPGRNLYGIYPTGKDQPVLAEHTVRHRGEAYCALVGDAETVSSIDDSEIPVVWEPLPAVTFEDAHATPDLHPHAPGNVLCRGRVSTGDVAKALKVAPYHATIRASTAFVEHAYIEPEAGYARRVGDRIEIVACTQTPYMDLDELAPILGLKPDQVRVIPTAVGGGFGGKLDLSLQPLAAIAAWKLNRPVRIVYSRPESMVSTTKRHPARIEAEAACDADGRLTAFRFHGDFDTGAYASWGPTVANRVPVHAMGPYRVANALCTTTALHTNGPPSGAFRGFGVPQAAIAGEALMDDLAHLCGLDPLSFRYRNALRVGDKTCTGQELGAGAALPECLEALAPRWHAWRGEADAFNRSSESKRRRGVGVACMWYGIGNTSMSNPSHMIIGITPQGRAVLLSGAVDIGQGSNTIMCQIAADALGIAVSDLDLVHGDTDLTPDAGKTSASRQTFVSGNAARLAGAALRTEILARTGGEERSEIILREGQIIVGNAAIDCACLPVDDRGFALRGDGRYDPPTTPLDEDGQGIPYASFAFAAQVADVEVDIALGTVKVLRIAAAHDVGRAVNPTQVEGQIHGGIAQGLGLALMEEYIPGRTDNLHDYLIPTSGDIPPIETFLIERPDPLGPYGAKGVGEPALVATAPAILNAIHHATGVRITQVPATPARVLAALTA